MPVPVALPTAAMVAVRTFESHRRITVEFKMLSQAVFILVHAIATRRWTFVDARFSFVNAATSLKMIRFHISHKHVSRGNAFYRKSDIPYRQSQLPSDS